MPARRRQARILAMQALCQWDVQRDEAGGPLADFLQAEDAPTRVVEYAELLVTTYWRLRKSVDQRITATSTKWDLPRMSPVDRNVLRVAVVELLVGDVPPRAVLDEAIEIGKEFGDRDSSRFINGILDQVLMGLDQSQEDTA